MTVAARLTPAQIRVSFQIVQQLLEHIRPAFMDRRKSSSWDSACGESRVPIHMRRCARTGKSVSLHGDAR